jgi:hypothetical protein
LVDEVADLLPLGEVLGEGVEGGLLEGLHAVEFERAIGCGRAHNIHG